MISSSVSVIVLFSLKSHISIVHALIVPTARINPSGCDDDTLCFAPEDKNAVDYLNKNDPVSKIKRRNEAKNDLIKKEAKSNSPVRDKKC